MESIKKLIAGPRDRHAELLVVVVVVVALLLGGWVKAASESRSVPIEVGGAIASYSYGWVREEPTPPAVLTIVDPASSARFRTEITVQVMDSADPEQDIAASLNQGRSKQRDLYRALGGEMIEWRKQGAYRNEFAYVYASPDVLRPDVPTIVRGVDHVFKRGDATWVVTYAADESEYDTSLIELMRFLRSIELE